MKVSTLIDEKIDEEVIIRSKKRTQLVDEIENICLMDGVSLTGTYDDEMYKLNPTDVSYFEANNNYVFAIISDKEYRLKLKLYQLEEMLPDIFIKINQSKLANIKKIKKFSSSIGGAIMVTFDNDKTDYISRRELKKVKERLGL